MIAFKYLFTALIALALVGAPSSAQAQEGEATDMGFQPRKKKSKAGMKKLFKILKKEPTIKQTQNWALRHYKLDPSRINGMATNARLKGLVPQVDLSFENSQGSSFGNMRDGLYPILPNDFGNNPDNLKERTAGTNSNNVFRVRAIWTLSRLVFNAEGLDVKSLNSLGETLVREVATLYFSRRRLLASIILSPPEDPEEMFFELTRLDEITATLDSLTGNKFSKQTWQWDDAMLGI